MTFDVLGGIPEVKSVVRSRSAVEDILERGRVFSRDDVVDGKNCGIALALRDALAYAGPAGFVASMPELIAARVAVAVPTGDDEQPFDRSHWLWRDWCMAHSEEHVGPNYTRRFYPRESHVVVVVHGGGLLSPERIFRAYADGLVRGAARYTKEEFRSLLCGQLPDGELPLFAYDDALAQRLPRRCGIVLPYSLVAEKGSCHYAKKEFLQHPLVLARNAGPTHLEEYFDRASWVGMLGCFHPFSRTDQCLLQGRVLFLDYLDRLRGDGDLDYYGRFVGVAPEARR